MRALVIGATGATGKDFLALLLQDDSFRRVDIFVRRAPDIRHEKLHIHVIGFNEPEKWRHLVTGDVLFSCLGTTLKTAGSKAAQWEIDYAYQYLFAKIARENGVSSYVLVSSAFSSPKSPFHYPMMKGRLEEAVKALGFTTATIFRPPTLIRRNSDRPLEVLGVKVMRFFNKIGLFRSQKPLPTEVLAHAMINAARTTENGIHIIEGRAIWRCASPAGKKPREG